MRTFIYPAKLESDMEEGGYVVTFRDVPVAVTQGQTLEEAAANAADALSEAIAGHILDEEPIPEPSAPLEGELPVALPLQMALKTALYIAIKEKGLSKRALAKLLDVDEKEARRILDPHHGTRLPVIEKALTTMGRKIEVGIL